MTTTECSDSRAFYVETLNLQTEMPIRMKPTNHSPNIGPWMIGGTFVNAGNKFEHFRCACVDCIIPSFSDFNCKSLDEAVHM